MGESWSHHSERLTTSRGGSDNSARPPLLRTLIDTMLNENRDLAAAKAFFESARTVVGFKPELAFTDGHTPYPGNRGDAGKACGAPRHFLSVGPVEPDHRGIKQRYYPTLGFKAQETAAVFCRGREANASRCVAQTFGFANEAPARRFTGG